MLVGSFVEITKLPDSPPKARSHRRWTLIKAML